MKITKFGHSCVLLDDGSTKILFDPGVYSEIPELAVDAIIITHVHQDHMDVDKIKKLLSANKARIITNTETTEELAKSEIESEIVEQGGSATVGTFTLEAFGTEHAIMHAELPKFQNTGYLVNDKIFHPGDALLLPAKELEILFLPIAAPWSKVSETLDYISEVKAKINFPIHDGFINGGGAFYRFASMWCEKLGLQLIEPELNKEYEF